MNFRKILAVATVMCVAFTSFAFAGTESALKKPIGYGTLTNQYGESYIVDIYEAPSISAKNLSNDTATKTIIADLSTAKSLNRTSINRDKWDTTSSVKFSSTIYLDEQGGIDKPVKLTKVTGGYTISDSTVQITSQTILAGCSDSYGPAPVTQSKTFSPKSSSFSYSTGFTKYSKTANGLKGMVGAKYSAKLKRGGSTWSFSFDNLY